MALTYVPMCNPGGCEQYCYLTTYYSVMAATTLGRVCEWGFECVVVGWQCNCVEMGIKLLYQGLKLRLLCSTSPFGLNLSAVAVGHSSRSHPLLCFCLLLASRSPDISSAPFGRLREIKVHSLPSTGMVPLSPIHLVEVLVSQSSTHELSRAYSSP